MKRIILAVFILAATGTLVAAQLYRWVDSYTGPQSPPNSSPGHWQFVKTVTVDAGVSSRVRPSGGDVLRASMAMRPAAPGRLSTMTLRAYPGASLSAIWRLTTSALPPGG